MTPEGFYWQPVEDYAHEEITVSNAVKTLTAANYLASATHPRARAVFITVRTAPVCFRVDGGDPVAQGAGHLVQIGERIRVGGITDIKNFRAIREFGVDAKLEVSYAA